MANAIAGFFRTRDEGEGAQAALLSNGFTRNEVSFLAGDAKAHEMPAVGPAPGVAAEEEAGQDAFIGGAVGLAAGALAGALPVVGLLALGPLGLALGGMSAGAALGGLVGLLKEHGVSEEEAEFYAQGVRRGGSLVTVHEVSGDREQQAQEIMKQHGAIDVEELAEEQRAQRL